MSTIYQVKIKPVQENREDIIDTLSEYIGPNLRAEAERLTEEGGTVISELNRQAADNIKKQLEKVGAAACIVAKEETGDELPKEHQEREMWLRYELTGRLLDEETDEPLNGYLVRAMDEDPEPDRDLGRSVTDKDGRFNFSYRTPLDSDRRRPIRLTVLSQDGEMLDGRLFDVQLDQPEELEWRISRPKPPNPGEDVPVRDITDGIPDDAIAELEEKGVKTLADVRSVDVLMLVNGIGDVQAKELRAHANLSLLKVGGEVREKLIEKGYSSTIDIARTPSGIFTRSVGEEIEDADRLHAEARTVVNQEKYVPRKD